ncbi:hypothetical protein ACFC6U_26130 [Kitasatospora purpeofusca]|uniref:hypothetical protein n=1 Tax=Kitasatospora purpeofusca TaxID=67352 RepID=UPI0035DDDC8C
MGSSFNISADREHVGPWTFTAEQVQASVLGHWPQATVSGAFENFLEIVADVGAARPAELSYNLRHAVFSFEDRGSPVAPLTVVHQVLHDLAPTVPVVWWIDYDVDLQPLDLTRGLDAFIAGFPA